MTKVSKNVWYAAMLVGGVVAVVLGAMEVIDGYWSGLGGGLAGVGGMRLVLAARAARDPAYARRVEVSNSDERNAFVAGRSAATTFRLSVLVLGVLSVVLYPFGRPDVARMLGMVMCAELVMYWVTYLVLSRRY